MKSLYSLSPFQLARSLSFVTLSLIFNPRVQVGLDEQRAGVHRRPRQLQPQREDCSPDQGGQRCHQLWLRLF